MANSDDIGLRHFRMFNLLIETESVTRTAEILGVSQSSISKMLARLRGHFGDPLFVRSGLAMHPTPRALGITAPLKELLNISETIQHTLAAFDPKTSSREFRVLVSEVGMIQHVPPLNDDLERAGRRLRLRAVPLDSRQFASKLETGEADVAFGAFPGVTGSLRRQKLYTDTYVSVARRSHPRLGRLARIEGFLAERHIVVTASSTGHAAHRQLERVMATRLGPEQIMMSVPSFLTCAFLASRTDAIGSMPAKLAEYLARDLDLAVFPTPLNLPRIDIAQVWHERLNRDPAHRWLRSRIATLFRPS